MTLFRLIRLTFSDLRFFRGFRRTISFLFILGITYAVAFNACTVFAQESPSSKQILETKKPPVPASSPTIVMLDITGYYSPLPDQERYVTGSYEGDIALNGNGVHGADGTPVYPGMVAAPSSYPFGMKMFIPGIGTVAVHDRGGAIVSADPNAPTKNRYDRLDIWMGYGDKGLDRALSWGRRVVKVTLYGIDPSIQEQVFLDGFSPSEQYVRPALVRLLPDNIWYLSKGPDVVTLQKILISLGYFRGPVTGFYDDDTRDAVFAFQKDHDLFDDAKQFGAGHSGQATAIALEKAFVERRRQLAPKSQLGFGSRGDEVKKLQRMLSVLGYRVLETGIFDQQTYDAVLRFQLDHNVIAKNGAQGSGYFGWKTSGALEKRYVAYVTHNQDFQIIDVPDYAPQDLKKGDTGPAVRQLQAELKRLHFLALEPTGNYGEVTEHAVFKFQQSQSLAHAMSDEGAGVFRDATRTRMNALIATRTYVQHLLTAKNPPNTSNPSNTAAASRTVAKK